MKAPQSKGSSSVPAAQTVKTYTFKVTLPSHGDCWRKIEIKSNQTLQMLHRVILDAYDFDDDHLYSFFMSNRAWDKKTEYSLPEGTNPFPFDEDAEETEILCETFLLKHGCSFVEKSAGASLEAPGLPLV